MNRKSEVIGVSFCIGRDQTKITVYEWRTMSNATDTLAANLHRVGFMLVSDAHVLTSKMGASVNYSTSDDGKEVPFIITFQFYFELVLAIYSLFMAGFTLNFIIRRDLPARGLDRSLKNVFSPATSLLIPSFLGLASFFVCSALYYSHIFPEAGFAQFFAIGIIHGSDCWYSWLRSGQVVRLHYSPKAVRFLQVELCAIPFLFLAPAIIQFAPIGLAKSIKYASIAMSVAIIVVVNLDLNYLNVFLRQMTCLKEGGVSVPPSYAVIARYATVSTCTTLLALTFYSVSAFMTDPQIASALLLVMDCFLVCTPTVLLFMKIKLIAPTLLHNWSGRGARGRTRDFFTGSGSADVGKKEAYALLTMGKRLQPLSH